MQVDTVPLADYESVLDSLKWNHALLSILLENEGGLVEISQEVVENYDLRGTIQVEFDDARAVYRVSAVPATIEGEIVD